MTALSKTRLVFVCCCVLSLVLACSPNQPADNHLMPVQQPTEVLNTTSEADSPAQSELEDVSTPLNNPLVVMSDSNDVSAENEVLQFQFPTPAPTDDQNWRPPLYEIPWAPGPYDHFYFVRPIAVDEINWPLPDYRYGGTFFAPDIVHTGIDIAAPRNTPVLAAAKGRVVWAENGLYFGVYNPDDPYGLAVVIEHEFGYQNEKLYTVYAHMDRIDVTLGQEVNTHDPIGVVGDTGYTTGPHLHFEVRTGNNSFYKTRNPELWIAPPQGWGVLVGRLLNQQNGVIEKLDVYVRSSESNRSWSSRTYTMRGINSDDYYAENFVLSDLPRGVYTIQFTYKDQSYLHEVEIHPGAVTFFTFHPVDGFSDDPPAAADNDFIVLSNP